MATTTTSRSYNNFWNLRAKATASNRARDTASSNHCSRLDGVAMWVINGVATAFFASLERCSCIRVNTVEDADDINELPLIYNDGNTTTNDTTTTTLNGSSSSSSKIKKRSGRGKKGSNYGNNNNNNDS